MSLTQSAYLYGVTSPWLNPCNYTLRPTTLIPYRNQPIDFIAMRNGKIESQLETIDLFKREEKGWGHTAGKPVRLVARAVYHVGIALFLAPLDATYDACKFLEHSFKFFAGAQDTNAAKHFCDFWVHISVFAVTALFATPFVISIATLGTSPVFAVLPAISLAFDIKGIGVSCFVSSDDRLTAFKNKYGVTKGLPVDDRLMILKSILLREHFGLVNKEGDLLPTTPYTTSTVLQFEGIEIDAADAMLGTISNLQLLLPSSKKIPSHYPLNPNTIEKHLAAQGLETAHQETLTNIRQWSDQLTELGNIRRTIATFEKSSLYELVFGSTENKDTFSPLSEYDHEQAFAST